MYLTQIRIKDGFFALIDSGKQVCSTMISPFLNVKNCKNCQIQCI